MHNKPILDVACGTRMFYFDKSDPRVLYCDIRSESFTKKRGEQIERLHVTPDVVCDFTHLPFPSESFKLVVFDPPHLLHAGETGWQAKTYGRLSSNWQDIISQGFAECFRVLARAGTLIFKWNECDIPVSKILALTPEKPVFGNRCGRLSKSHWLCFFKLNV